MLRIAGHELVVVLVGGEIFAPRRRRAAGPVERVAGARALGMVGGQGREALLGFFVLAVVEGVFAQPEADVLGEFRAGIVLQELLAGLERLGVLPEQVEAPAAHEHRLRRGRGARKLVADAREIVQRRLERAHAVVDEAAGQQGLRARLGRGAGGDDPPVLFHGGLKRPALLVERPEAHRGRAGEFRLLLFAAQFEQADLARFGLAQRQLRFGQLQPGAAGEFALRGRRRQHRRVGGLRFREAPAGVFRVRFLLQQRQTACRIGLRGRRAGV